jgi:hypothetical protein
MQIVCFGTALELNVHTAEEHFLPQNVDAWRATQGLIIKIKRLLLVQVVRTVAKMLTLELQSLVQDRPERVLYMWNDQTMQAIDLFSKVIQ